MLRYRSAFPPSVESKVLVPRCSCQWPRPLKTRGLMLPLRFFNRKQAGRADLQLELQVPRALSRAKKTKLTRVLSESDVYLSSSSPASESRFVSRLPFRGGRVPFASG
jgi:hypothetical protein